MVAFKEQEVKDINQLSSDEKLVSRILGSASDVISKSQGHMTSPGPAFGNYIEVARRRLKDDFNAHPLLHPVAEAMKEMRVGDLENEIFVAAALKAKLKNEPHPWDFG